MEPIKVNDRRRFAGFANAAADGVAGKPLSVNEEVEEILDELVKQHPDMTAGDVQHAQDGIRQQLLQQRVMYRTMLQRAQQELARVNFKQLRAAELKTVGGVRNKFILTLGKFVYGHDATWLFEVNNAEMLEKAMRFSRMKDASNKGLLVHKQLMKTCTLDEDGKVTAEGWKQGMAENIAQELAALEVE